jgi:hypothetical protein
MPANTTAVAVAVADALPGHPDGITARKLAGQLSAALPAVNDALAAMEAAGTAVRTEGAPTGNGNRRSANVWTPAPDTTETPDALDDDATDAYADGDGDEGDDVAASAPVSGAPAGSPDHYKIVMVAGMLGAFPQGVSASVIANESGLRASIVGRVLTALEAAGAAVRTADEDGAEVWRRGEGDLATVTLVVAPTYCVCTCGHRHRVGATTSARRPAGAPGQNGDGQKTLGKNELRGLVAEFLRNHPGHEFTAGTVARELDRSSGAVGNALDKLALTGEARVTSQTPMKYTTATA